MVATVTALDYAITPTLKGGKRRTSPRLYAALAAEAPGRSKTQTRTQTRERRCTRSGP